MVQDIVQEVMAKMQITSDVSGSHGVFKDMNEAIAAAKKTQKIVGKMSMDQREKIISNIRTKIKENAEIMARGGWRNRRPAWEMWDIDPQACTGC